MKYRHVVTGTLVESDVELPAAVFAKEGAKAETKAEPKSEDAPAKTAKPKTRKKA